jgi:hypothetical protein
MPPKGRSKKIVVEVAAEPVAVAVAVAAPVPAPAPAPAPEPVPKAKKTKKQPKIVAVVTPEGIEGSFLPEPRRPLIAHLQINTTEVQFHENPLQYDPNPPGQPEPYDATALNFFGKHNEELAQEALLAAALDQQQETEAQTHTHTHTQIEKEVKETKEDSKAVVGLDAFTKCDLMVQYRELKKSKKIPEKTDIACFWCAHPFTWQPSIIPEREEKGTYRVYGNFCSPNCCMAYLLTENLDTHVRWERIALLHRLYGNHYSSGRIFPSPARECLSLFGGSVPIQQYRATIASGKVRVDIQTPPMVSILGSIDTKPIDFYDSSMKHTISPLLGEIVPKAEEGLRLKRSKPLKERESTLDSVLKIQIKSKS